MQTRTFLRRYKHRNIWYFKGDTKKITASETLPATKKTTEQWNDLIQSAGRAGFYFHVTLPAQKRDIQPSHIYLHLKYEPFSENMSLLWVFFFEFGVWFLAIFLVFVHFKGCWVLSISKRQTLQRRGESCGVSGWLAALKQVSANRKELLWYLYQISLLTWINSSLNVSLCAFIYVLLKFTVSVLIWGKRTQVRAMNETSSAHAHAR